MENTKEKEITLQTLWAVFKKSIIFMVIAAVVLGAVAAVGVKLFAKPSYKGTATFWVNNASIKQDYTSSAQTSAAIAIAASCVELVKEDLPVRRAVEEGGLTEKLGYKDDNECVLAIREMISAGQTSTGLFIFYVDIEGDDPAAVYEIVTAFQSVLPEVMTELLTAKDAANSDTNVIAVIGPVNDVEEIKTITTSPIKTFILVGLIAAVIVYIIFLVSMILDTVVYSEQTLKDNFDLPILGVIPNWVNSNSNKKDSTRRKRRASGVDVSLRDYSDRLLGEKTPFAIAEAFNHLRTNIVFSAGGNGDKCAVVGITSAISGAGKSFMSANLAYSLSSLGKRVLLVECDMRCPTLSRIFGIKNDIGLSELLAGINDEDGSSYIVNYEGKFDIIFSGEIPPNPSELLSGDTMKHAVDVWRNNYDVVIFDMPPIGEVADAGVVSPLVDGYLVTVRCDYSDTKEVKSAVETIHGVNGKIYGFILNDYNPKRSRRYYYKHSYSYYSHYSKYESAKKKN